MRHRHYERRHAEQRHQQQLPGPEAVMYGGSHSAAGAHADIEERQAEEKRGDSEGDLRLKYSLIPNTKCFNYLGRKKTG